MPVILDNPSPAVLGQTSAGKGIADLFGSALGMFAGGGLPIPGISASSSASTGPVNVGQTFTPSFSSPFAVGSGATATSTQPIGGTVTPPPANQTALVLAIVGAAAVVALALIASRK